MLGDHIVVTKITMVAGIDQMKEKRDDKPDEGKSPPSITPQFFSQDDAEDDKHDRYKNEDPTLRREQTSPVDVDKQWKPTRQTLHHTYVMRSLKRFNKVFCNQKMIFEFKEKLWEHGHTESTDQETDSNQNCFQFFLPG